MLKFIFLFLFLFLNFNNNVIAGGGIIAPSSNYAITGIIRPDYCDVFIGGFFTVNPDAERFWVEEKPANNNGIGYWWFPVYGLPTGITQRYYIYYDNLTYTHNKSNLAMFPVYDDFSNPSLYKWVITATSNRPFVEAGQLCISARSNECGNLGDKCLGVMRYHTAQKITDFVLDFDIMRFSQSPYNGYAKVGWQCIFDKSFHRYIGLGTVLDTNHFDILLYAGREGNHKSQTGLQSKFPPMFWHKFSFRNDVDNQVPISYFGTTGNYNMMSLTLDSFFDLEYGYITIGENMRAGKFYIDNIRLRRKLHFPEPIVTYGQEEVGNWAGFTKRRLITIVNNSSFSYNFECQLRIPINFQTIPPVLRVIGVGN